MAFSYINISLNSKTFWAAKRASAAKVLLNNIKNDFPKYPQSSIYVKDDPFYPKISNEWGSSSRQDFYIMSGSDALKLIYNDPTIKVYYEAINPENEFRNINSVEYIARFPY